MPLGISSSSSPGEGTGLGSGKLAYFKHRVLN